MQEPLFWKTGEVAKRLQMSPRCILDWARKGRLPSIRTPGGHRLYPAAGVEEARRQMYGTEQ
jgi:excisionase family DNA binding protein